MSSSESNESIPGSPLPRKIQEMPTRYPTTNKKKELNSASFRRTLPHEVEGGSSQRCRSARISKSQHLRESLLTLRDEKYRCLERGRYGDASQLQSEIKRTRSMLNRTELKSLDRTHLKEKNSIRSAYQQEIAFFQSAWDNYFQKYRERQKAKIDHFRLQQSSEIDFVREKLRKKCGSLRHPSRQVLELEKQEQYYFKQGNIAELMMVRKEKKRLIGQLKAERRQMIDKWTQIEGNQLEKFQSKRYQILMGRVAEQQKDQEKAFISQKKRLKQKYKNILSQLRHEQVMTTFYVTRRQTEY